MSKRKPVTESMPVVVSSSGSVTPVPYAKTDEKRGDSHAIRDTTQPRNGTPAEGSVNDEGSVPDSRTENEPAAWAVICGDCVDSTFTDRDEAVEWACGIIPPAQIVPLYRQPQPVVAENATATLTDAEREAIKEAADAYEQNNGDPDCERIADTLHGLLDRTKGGER